MSGLAGTAALDLTRRRVSLSFVPLALACGVLLLVGFAAVAPGVLAGGSPLATDPTAALQPPSAHHWFGTDEIGRDVFSRVVYGTRPAILVGLVALLAAATLGAVWGLVAGLSGRIGDMIAMRTADAALAFPELLLALVVIVLLGKGPVAVTVAIALAMSPGLARLVRAQTLVVRRSEYVEAVVGLGLSRPRVVLRHVLPNTLTPLVSVATVWLGAALMTAAALSYLGLGVQPPQPEWASILAAGQDYLYVAWWISLFPGLTIVLTVVSVAVAGRTLQDRLAGWSG